jgi:hypothetical protein
MAKSPLEVAGKLRDVIEAQAVRYFLDGARLGQQATGVLQALLAEPDTGRGSQVSVEPPLQVPDRDAKVPRDSSSIVSASAGCLVQSMFVDAQSGVRRARLEVRD